jgi:hypothetical protein
MKVVSVLLFAILLIGTWSLVHSKRPVAESVHVGIQNDLRAIITEYVQKNVPESKNVVFEKMWTETVRPDQVRAKFVYSFEDVDSEGEPAKIAITGSAVLNKAEESPEMIIWNLDELKILDNTVSFAEPIQITAGAGQMESGDGSADDSPTAPESGD